MTSTRRDEERYLSADERELVAASRHPGIGALSNADLASLRKQVRERRDRATTIARQQRREIRGKGTPRGASPASADSGSRMKASLLAQAMKRLNAEASRRREKARSATTADNMRRALAMKQAAPRPAHPGTRTAGQGMHSIPNRTAEQITDPREVGRVSQFVKQGQARRDF